MSEQRVSTLASLQFTES